MRNLWVRWGKLWFSWEKNLVNMFHVKHGMPTQTNPVWSPLLVFSAYLVRKHIYQYNNFHFLVAEASLVGSQNDTTEEQSLTSMFGEKTQERQHLFWGREWKHWAIFQNKWTNKNRPSSHYKVSAVKVPSNFFWVSKVNQSQARL